MAYVTVVPVMLILSFFLCKIRFSTSLASRHQDAMDALGLHNVLWITKHESRIILAWKNNLTKEETEKYTVKYILNYKFFNTTREMKERLQEMKKIIRLELHSGFNAKVKTQVFAKEREDLIKEGGWTEFTYTAPPVYIQNLSCVIYNISFFNCTWHIKAEAPEDIQIFFSYRHVGKDFECQKYIKNARKKNIGCHMKEIYFQPSRKINLNITVTGVKNNSRGLSYYKTFTPQTIEKLNPPINVSVSFEKRSVKIHWKPPPTIGSASKKCFLYQVKITNRKNGPRAGSAFTWGQCQQLVLLRMSQQAEVPLSVHHAVLPSCMAAEPVNMRNGSPAIVDVTAEKYEYPFHKPANKCAAQVRVKKEICIRNKLWSEWSEPVFIYNEKTVDVMLLSLTLFCLLIFLGGLLICACRRYRCLEVITMPVPHPSDNIKTWLAADETHHQKQMSVQMEMHSEVTMKIPGENGDENFQQQIHLKESGLEDL